MQFDSDKFEDGMKQSSFLSMLESKFEEKPYREEHGWWYFLVQATSWICQVVNVAAGLGKPVAYLTALFAFGPGGFIVALAISLFIVVGVEYAARMNAVKIWEKYFLKKRTPSIGRVIAQLSLMSIIIALSYFGAPDAVQMMTPTPSKQVVNFEDEAAVHAFYDKQISDAQRAADDFKKARTWRDRLSDRDGKTYSGLLDKTVQLRDRLTQEVENVRQRNRDKDANADAALVAALANKETEDAKNGSIFALIAIFSCGLFFLCIYLKERYEYVCLVEAIQEGSIKHNGIAQTIANAERIVDETVTDKDLVAELRAALKLKAMQNGGYNGHTVGK